MGWRFLESWVLWTLWLVLAAYFLLQWVSLRREKKLAKNIRDRLLPFLTESVSLSKRRWRLRLELVALSLMILAYARPQTPEGKVEVKNEGIEIVLMVDVSNSMLAEDIRPSRLQLAKSELTRFVDLAGGNRIALIAFAGSAALLSPMTTDQEAIKMYIDSLDPSVVSTQGTNFSRALTEASSVFDRGGLGNEEGSQVTRAIVIASDGEDLEDGAKDEIEKLVQAGVYVFTIGFGTEQGGAIPVRDEQGVLRGYKRGADGQVIVSKTQGKVLKEMAKEGRGSFHHATFEGDAMTAIIADINELKKAQFETGQIRSFSEEYQWFLIFAFICACWGLLMSDRKNLGRIWRGRFEVKHD